VNEVILVADGAALILTAVGLHWVSGWLERWHDDRHSEN